MACMTYSSERQRKKKRMKRKNDLNSTLVKAVE